MLIPEYIDSELAFWIQTENPDKKRAPREDGTLEQEENTYSYVAGQTNTSYSGSPLVSDEMNGPGTFGEWHPWLEAKRAEGIMVDPKIFAGLFWAASRNSSAEHSV